MSLCKMCALIQSAVVFLMSVGGAEVSMCILPAVSSQSVCMFFLKYVDYLMTLRFTKSVLMALGHPKLAIL